MHDPGSLPFCYLTTVGRVTERPHRIEIWFALADRTVYLLAGDPRSDWVRNLTAEPAVRLEIGARAIDTTARIVAAGTEEDAKARRMLYDKYQSGSEDDLTSWSRSALPVAIGWPAA
jgi:deazaflavin-dependent oxidoreductase (nitroreductase family)